MKERVEADRPGEIFFWLDVVQLVNAVQEGVSNHSLVFILGDFKGSWPSFRAKFLNLDIVLERVGRRRVRLTINGELICGARWGIKNNIVNDKLRCLYEDVYSGNISRINEKRRGLMDEYRGKMKFYRKVLRDFDTEGIPL